MKAIIIDDEPDSTELLYLQLAKHCPQVKVLGRYTDSTDGLEAIVAQKPQLLFLDIEMPVMNGFELLEKVGDIQLQVIFVTAYNQFAIKAFKFNALDYLVKPIDAADLKAAVAKAGTQHAVSHQQVASLRSHYQGEPLDKIAVPYQQHVLFIAFKDIVFAESSSNYTKLILEDGRHFMVSKTLGDVQEVLEERNFLRVHRQYIINLNKIKQLFRGDNTYVVMENGANIPVACNQKEKLVERFGWL